MNKLLTFFKTIRLINLLMIALVQWIVSMAFVEVFQLSFYLLIMLSTICIALAAYLLNDIADIKIDIINHKLKLINTNNQRFWFKVVVLLNAIGLVFGFLASYYSQLSLFIYFITAVILLSVYAYFFSKYKPIGNLIISALIALAILLCFYLEIHHFYFDRIYYSSHEIQVWLYAACAFLLNWLREIVKDIEDREGDAVVGRVSIPILFGLKMSKFLTSIIIIFFAVIFALAAFKMNLVKFQSQYFILLFIYTIYVLVALLFSVTKKQFANLSFKIKLLMLACLLLPIIF